MVVTNKYTYLWIAFNFFTPNVWNVLVLLFSKPNFRRVRVQNSTVNISGIRVNWFQQCQGTGRLTNPARVTAGAATAAAPPLVTAVASGIRDISPRQDANN